MMMMTDDDDDDVDDDDVDVDDDVESTLLTKNLWNTEGRTHLTKSVLPDWQVNDMIFGCSGALTSVHTFCHGNIERNRNTNA